MGSEARQPSIESWQGSLPEGRFFAPAHQCLQDTESRAVTH